jgi:hypothetical protein
MLDILKICVWRASVTVQKILLLFLLLLLLLCCNKTTAAFSGGNNTQTVPYYYCGIQIGICPVSLKYNIPL